MSDTDTETDRGTGTDTVLSPYAMPSLGADMDEGSVVEWLVDVGDEVERGQVVARVETEKSDIDIEIWHGGVVEEIVVGRGRTVPVGTTLMLVRRDDAETRETRPVPVEAQPEPVGVEPAVVDTPSASESDDHARRDPADVRWATPLARRLAGERGIELAGLSGSGPSGAIRAVDLPEWSGATGSAPASTATPPTPPDGPSTAASHGLSRSDRMRSKIAERMTISNDEIPHYRLEQRIDVTDLLARLATGNANRSIEERVVPAAAFVHAVATAARRHPQLNGTWVSGGMRQSDSVNVSVAISLRGGGLVTPTLPDADRMTVEETMAALRVVTTAARAGTLRSEWTTATSSITVTNLGDRGADLVHGLISPPEVALVGFGRIVERAEVIDGEVVPRSVVIATLAADHRATDGAVGSRFLATLAHTLQETTAS